MGGWFATNLVETMLKPAFLAVHRLLRTEIAGPVMIVALLIALWVLFVRGNPGGIPDAEYAKFKRLAPPKLLYSCTRKRLNSVGAPRSMVRLAVDVLSSVAQ